MLGVSLGLLIAAILYAGKQADLERRIAHD
jgi:hypothetical protein